MGLLSTIGAASARAYGFTRSAIAAAVDAYFNRVTLLLPGNGTNGAQNNTFLDSSTNNFTITRNGNTTQGTFSPFSQTGWSNYFDGADDYLYQDSLTNWKFLHDGSSWTLEFDIFHSSTSLQVLFATARTTANAGISIQINAAAANDVSVYFFNGSSVPGFNSTANLVVNTWNHVGITFDGTTKTFTFYINGVQRGSSSNTGYSYSSSNSSFGLHIGAEPSTLAYDYSGYISNLRISNTVRTGMTTVPTAAYSSDANTKLLTCQSNRFIDNSTNAFAITVNGTPSVQAFSPFAPTAAYSAATNGGSGYFDGTGDFLSSSSTLTFGTNAFTVEFWVYPLAASTGMVFCCSTNGAIQVQLVASSGQLNLNIGTYGTGATLSTTGTPVKLNQWNHVVAVRSATSTNGAAIFVNGSRNIQGTVSTNYVAGAINVGAIPGGTQSVNGYMSGFVVTNGTANYSPSGTSITVPTAPPSPTGSTLCINFTNGGIIDATGKNVLETVGNAQISTTQSKWGGSSIVFNGSNANYLNVIDGSCINFGTGDFVVELWAYMSDTNVYSPFIRADASGDFLDCGYDWGANELKLATRSAAIFSASATISANTWTHVAFARSGTSLRAYVNGSQVGSTTTDSTNFAKPTGIIRIGASSFNAGHAINGYIDDLRITRGSARGYTGSTITVPTAPFSLQ